MLEAFKFFWKSWLVFVLAIILIFASFLIYQSMFIDSQYAPPYHADNNCNIATIPLAGVMSIGVSQNGEYSNNGDLDNLLWKLDAAKNDSNIKGVMLQVDSFGGYGSVGEILAKYLSNYPKPIVSYVREAALSNAYWSILPSKFIVSHRTSSVGSIGVTMSYLSQAKKNKEEGLDYISISSGKFKDAGNPDKELTTEEYAYYLEEIKKFAQVFKDDVSLYRQLSSSTVDELADCRSFMGEEAVRLGLIDAVGDESIAVNWFDENVFGVEDSKAKAILCKPSY